MKLAPGLAVSQSVDFVSACSVVPASKISDLMRSAGMAPQISWTPSMKPAMRWLAASPSPGLMPLNSVTSPHLPRPLA
jgi:hypothetical protein